MKKIILLSLLANAIFSCSSKEGDLPTKTNELADDLVQLTEVQFKNAQIKTDTLTQAVFNSTLNVNGFIDVPPQNMLSVSAPLGGFLKSTKLLAGMHVKKGELLAILEDAEYVSLQRDYLESKMNLQFVEEEYNRLAELNKSKAVSDKVYQQAKTTFHLEKIKLRSFEEKLKLIGLNPSTLTISNMSKSIRLVSPIDGFVASVAVNVGKYCLPNDVLFELVDPSDIHLSLNVFEKDIHKLAIDQEVKAYSNSNPSKVFTGKVILTSKVLNKDKSLQVHCHLDNLDADLIPGMYMNAEIKTKGVRGYVVENKSIVRFEGSNYLFASLGNLKYKLVQINVVNSKNDLSQIEFIDFETAKNTYFVVEGAYTLLMKMKNVEEE